MYMENLIWKQLIDYTNYEISNTTLVRNIKTQKIIKPIIANDGYIHIRLTKDKKRKHFLLHRLVAFYYIDNPNNYKYVDHIDRDKQNNSISNLRWINMRDNLLNKNIKKTSIYSGVSYDKSTNKWTAELMEKRKRYKIGRFKNEIDAAKAYDDKLVELGLNRINLKDE